MKTMRRIARAAGVAPLALGVSSCSGSATYPTNPNGSSAPPTDAVVIDVVGINGAQSFSPNRATVPTGRPVVWHNVDTVTHRVVLDNGAVDTGNIGPRGFSAPMT